MRRRRREVTEEPELIPMPSRLRSPVVEDWVSPDERDLRLRYSLPAGRKAADFQALASQRWIAEISTWMRKHPRNSDMTIKERREFRLIVGSQMAARWRDEVVFMRAVGGSNPTASDSGPGPAER